MFARLAFLSLCLAVALAAASVCPTISDAPSQYYCTAADGSLPEPGAGGRTYFGSDISYVDCQAHCETLTAGCCESRASSWGGCNHIENGIGQYSSAHTDSKTVICTAASPTSCSTNADCGTEQCVCATGRRLADAANGQQHHRHRRNHHHHRRRKRHLLFGGLDSSCYCQ